MFVVFSLVSLKELVFWCWWTVFFWILLCCFITIMHWFSQSLSIVLQCGGLLLNVIFSFSRFRCIRWQGFCPDQTFLSLCHRRHVAALFMLYNVNPNWNHCLFSELPSSSIRVRYTLAAASAHPLEFEVSRCRTSQFARRFLPGQTRVSNDLPYAVFDTGALDGFKGAVNRWLLPGVCVSVFRGSGVCGVA